MSDPTDVFHELGDPTRLRVLLSIIRGPKNVSAIVSELGLSQPQASYHLRRLKDAGLAVEEKDGRWVWYEANHATRDARLRELLDLMARWTKADDASDERVGEEATGGSVERRRRGPRGAGVMRTVRRPTAARTRGRREDEGRPRVERPTRPERDMDDFLL